MTKTAIACILALMGLSFGLGVLLTGQTQVALAQETPADAAAANGDRPAGNQPAADVSAMTRPSDIVAAVPLVSRTDYEQDPFEPSRLRRTTTTVVKVGLVKQDGTVEAKNAP